MKTTLGSTGGSATSLGDINPSIQSVGIYNGQLYVTSTQANAPTIRVGSVGSGLPDTGGQSIVNLPGISNTVLTSPHSFFMANLETSNPNIDTLYVADNGTGLRKFSLVTGTWVLNGTIGNGMDTYRGLTGVVSGNHVGLFATRRVGNAVNGGGELVSIFDASGHNGNLTATPTLLATANPKKAFRGVALTPGNPTQSVVAIAAVEKTKMEGDGGGNTAFTFTVSRIGTTTSAINVDWNVTGLGSNPAHSSDFIGGIFPSGTLHFAANELSKTITVQLTADATYEPDEDFSVTLSNASGGAILSTSTAQCTIVNDDAPTEFRFGTNDLDKFEGTGTTTSFTFEIVRTGNTTVSSSIVYSISGSVQADDFLNQALPTETIHFSPGQLSHTVTLLVSGDTQVEFDDTLIVALSDPSPGSVVATSTLNGLIKNDDAAISISSATQYFAEGNSGSKLVNYTLTRSGYLGSLVSVDWNVSGGLNDSADGSDFVGGNFPQGTISFPADGLTTTQTISVPIQADTIAESDESYVIDLSSLSLGISVSGTGKGVIENDDVYPLAPGDIVITGMDTTNDSFSFVPLVALPSGIILKFTDAGWSGNAFTTTEGLLTFVVGSTGIPAGTEVTVTNVSSLSPTIQPEVAGSATSSLGMQLSTAGENLFVYQGANSAPLFLFAINFGSSYLTTGSPTNTTTYLPDSLKLGVSAVSSLGNVAVAQFNDSSTSGTKTQLRNAVALNSNWNTSTPNLTTQNFTILSNATIANRRVFYNRSTSSLFGDGSGNPINAIDLTKSALLPGQTTLGVNYTNYSRGLNGIVLDLSGTTYLPGISPASFQFAIWNNFQNSTPNFTAISPTMTVSTFAGGGTNASDRIKLDFQNNAIQNAWLRVTVLANPSTGLVTNDVFYFGNARFDVSPTNPFPSQQVTINAFDVNVVRANQGQNPGVISNSFDVDRNGVVNAFDTNLVRAAQGISSLRSFTAPSQQSFFAFAYLAPVVDSQSTLRQTAPFEDGFFLDHENRQKLRKLKETR
jgi:Calx-beta domain